MNYISLVVILLLVLLMLQILGYRVDKMVKQDEIKVIVQVARQYDLSQEDTLLLISIREQEGGAWGSEYGVTAAKGTDLRTQAQWCAGSIKANRARYHHYLQDGVYTGSRRNVHAKEVGTIDFISFMGYSGGPTGYGWAPIDAPGMSEKDIKLNKNWAPGVRNLVEKNRQIFKERGLEI